MKSSKEIAIVRILFFSLEYFLLARGNYFKLWAYVPSELWHPNGLMTFVEDPKSIQALIPYIFMFWKFTLPLLVVGLAYRIVAPLNAVAGFILINFAHSFGYQTHTFMPIVLGSLVLSFAPANTVLSLDKFIFRKPSIFGEDRNKLGLFNLRLILCLVYFSAGLSKIINGGISWINSDTLRNYFIMAYINYPDVNPTARQLSLNTLLYDYPIVCRILAVVVIMIEIAAPLALLKGAWSVVIIFGLLCLQISAYFTIFVNFQAYLILYIAWVPIIYEYFKRRAQTRY